MKYATLFLAVLLAAAPAQAQIKDSYYFMADDGVQSPEEVMEEAEYVFETCDRNVYQKDYFDCRCVAGTFLQARERLGSIAPQEEIVNDILYGRNARCANTEAIAGNAYSNCMAYAADSREYHKDNEEYCSCVGNTAAKRFSARPTLNAAYITRVESFARIDCMERNENGEPLRRRN